MSKVIIIHENKVARVDRQIFDGVILHAISYIEENKDYINKKENMRALKRRLDLAKSLRELLV